MATKKTKPIIKEVKEEIVAPVEETNTKKVCCI